MRDWTNDLHELCVKFNVEPVIAEKTLNLGIKKIAFHCPQELAAEEKAALVRTIPVDISSEFIVAPKETTIKILSTALLMVGIKIDNIQYDINARKLELTGHPLQLRMPTEDHPEGEEFNMDEILQAIPEALWTRLSYRLKDDGAIDKWQLLCNALTIDRDVKELKDPPADVGAELKSPPPWQKGSGPDTTVDKVFEATSKDVVTEKSFSSKKPARDICPTVDEITNLKIDLGNAQTVDDVLKLMEGK
jgi:hypothetical protein